MCSSQALPVPALQPPYRARAGIHPMATASLPLHSPSLLETGGPTGERAPGRASGGPSAERQWELRALASPKAEVLPLPSP